LCDLLAVEKSPQAARLYCPNAARDRAVLLPLLDS
jgi:hypothetical protein